MSYLRFDKIIGRIMIEAAVLTFKFFFHWMQYYHLKFCHFAGLQMHLVDFCLVQQLFIVV